MRIRPIMFNTEMVQAIMNDNKTQTRRAPKIQPFLNRNGYWRYGDAVWHKDNSVSLRCENHLIWKYAPCKPGDILWVRETWNLVLDFDNSDTPIYETERYVYFADNPMPFDYWVDVNTGEHKEQMPWKPSIHMPKEAARIFLRVKAVRFERLQEITEVQALMEGCYMYRTPGEIQPGHDGTAIQDFHRVWDNTVKPAERSDRGWDANPWVWVIEFERCERPACWEVYLYG